MPNNNEWYDNYVYEHYDLESILFILSCEILQLVDFLMHETQRLAQLVMEAREQSNLLAASLKYSTSPYPITDQDVWNSSFDDHPAMLRYRALYNGDATNSGVQMKLAI